MPLRPSISFFCSLLPDLCPIYHPIWVSMGSFYSVCRWKTHRLSMHARVRMAEEWSHWLLSFQSLILPDRKRIWEWKVAFWAAQGPSGPRKNFFSPNLREKLRKTTWKRFSSQFFGYIWMKRFEYLIVSNPHSAIQKLMLELNANSMCQQAGSSASINVHSFIPKREWETVLVRQLSNRFSSINSLWSVSEKCFDPEKICGDLINAIE